MEEGAWWRAPRKRRWGGPSEREHYFPTERTRTPSGSLGTEGSTVFFPFVEGSMPRLSPPRPSPRRVPFHDSPATPCWMQREAEPPTRDDESGGDDDDDDDDDDLRGAAPLSTALRTTTSRLPPPPPKPHVSSSVSVASRSSSSASSPFSSPSTATGPAPAPHTWQSGMDHPPKPSPQNEHSVVTAASHIDTTLKASHTPPPSIHLQQPSVASSRHPSSPETPQPSVGRPADHRSTELQASATYLSVCAPPSVPPTTPLLPEQAPDSESSDGPVPSSQPSSVVDPLAPPTVTPISVTLDRIGLSVKPSHLSLTKTSELLGSPTLGAPGMSSWGSGRETEGINLPIPPPTQTLQGGDTRSQGVSPMPSVSSHDGWGFDASYRPLFQQPSVPVVRDLGPIPNPEGHNPPSPASVPGVPSDTEAPSSKGVPSDDGGKDATSEAAVRTPVSVVDFPDYLEEYFTVGEGAVHKQQAAEDPEPHSSASSASPSEVGKQGASNATEGSLPHSMVGSNPYSSISGYHRERRQSQPFELSAFPLYERWSICDAPHETANVICTVPDGAQIDVAEVSGGWLRLADTTTWVKQEMGGVGWRPRGPPLACRSVNPSSPSNSRLSPCPKEVRVSPAAPFARATRTPVPVTVQSPRRPPPVKADYDVWQERKIVPSALEGWCPAAEGPFTQLPRKVSEVEVRAVDAEVQVETTPEVLYSPPRAAASQDLQRQQSHSEAYRPISDGLRFCAPPPAEAGNISPRRKAVSEQWLTVVPIPNETTGETTGETNETHQPSRTPSSSHDQVPDFYESTSQPSANEGGRRELHGGLLDHLHQDGASTPLRGGGSPRGYPTIEVPVPHDLPVLHREFPRAPDGRPALREDLKRLQQQLLSEGPSPRDELPAMTEVPCHTLFTPSPTPTPHEPPKPTALTVPSSLRIAAVEGLLIDTKLQVAELRAKVDSAVGSARSESNARSCAREVSPQRSASLAPPSTHGSQQRLASLLQRYTTLREAQERRAYRGADAAERTGSVGMVDGARRNDEVGWTEAVRPPMANHPPCRPALTPCRPGNVVPSPAKVAFTDADGDKVALCLNDRRLGILVNGRLLCYPTTLRWEAASGSLFIDGMAASCTLPSKGDGIIDAIRSICRYANVPLHEVHLRHL
eukprot:Sspe_Gene.90632::Locus_62152_Transcript_1_1_Confidence_1.000_Length_3571::g.90632::m.90632